jgi:hypothetical protein
MLTSETHTGKDSQSHLKSKGQDICINHEIDTDQSTTVVHSLLCARWRKKKTSANIIQT